MKTAQHKSKVANTALQPDWVEALAASKPGVIAKTITLELFPDQWMVVAEGASRNKITLGEALVEMIDRNDGFFVDWLNADFKIG